MRNTTTITSVLREAVAMLEQTSPSPRLDAELLLAHALGCSRLRLVIDGSAAIHPDAEATFREALARRMRREPVAYITGTKEFWGLDFAVTPNVLIPRPDTEILVEESLRLLSALPRPATREDPFRIVDLGTGSGCIALSVGYEARARGIPLAVVAVDASERALAVARCNAERLGVPVQFIHTSWVESFPPVPTFDLIVSNPPYIDPADTDRSPETAYEPKSALFADDEGLADIRHLLAVAPPLLRSGGSILLEVGVHQAQVVLEKYLPEECVGYTVCDLAGVERVVVVRAEAGTAAD